MEWCLVVRLTVPLSLTLHVEWCLVVRLTVPLSLTLKDMRYRIGASKS